MAYGLGIVTDRQRGGEATLRQATQPGKLAKQLALGNVKAVHHGIQLDAVAGRDDSDFGGDLAEPVEYLG